MSRDSVNRDTVSGAHEAPAKRLAIIGCGSSGLVTLKYALDHLPEWDVVCFEKSDRITGCWGDPYPGFVSTSTKYTTQFACYPKFDDKVTGDGRSGFDDFFCDGEYGQYLEAFADACVDRSRIQCNTIVEQIRPIAESGDWQLQIRSLEGNAISVRVEVFQAVIICTGLSARPRRIASDTSESKNPIFGPVSSCENSMDRPMVLQDISLVDQMNDKTVVVIGGGESAVDFADRLARPERGNRVFLSLQSGMRLSPRYHPIGGVPSDFLRNRLMLSIHPDLRNWIGEKFVAARIRYQEVFERWFPDRRAESVGNNEQGHRAQKQLWAMRLREAAKDDLFNMFHNKSDRFLDAVADGRISIVGPPTDRPSHFFEFGSEQTRQIEPDVIVPAIGYESQLEEISDGAITLEDFFLGCCHRRYHNIFLVGFARPIIGNVPTISEMQAILVAKLLGRDCVLPTDVLAQHQRDTELHRHRYSKLNLSATYPVEMIPYCDRLARIIDDYPSVKRCGSFRTWCRVQLTTSSTMHYHLRDHGAGNLARSAKVYMPALFIVLLLGIKPVDWTYRLICKLRPPR